MVFEGKRRGFASNVPLATRFLSSGAKEFLVGLKDAFLGLGKLMLGFLLLFWSALKFFGGLMLDWIKKNKGQGEGRKGRGRGGGRSRDGIPFNYRPVSGIKRDKENGDDWLGFQSPLLDPDPSPKAQKKNKDRNIIIKIER